MNKSFYFSHDFNTRMDVKVKSMIRKHGFKGYGIFWAIIEDLFMNENQLPTDWDAMGFDYRNEPDLIKSIICDFGLFELDDENFGSIRVEKRLIEITKLSKRAIAMNEKRWGKSDTESNAESDTESKEKKRKEKETKELPFKQIVDHLNLVCGNDYKFTTKSTQTKIAARFNEGFDLNDFIRVIEHKFSEWGNKKEMTQYLRPETLFGTKFEGYANASKGFKGKKKFDNDPEPINKHLFGVPKVNPPSNVEWEQWNERQKSSTK